VSNALDVNGNAYVSGQIITDGGINVLSGDINITGEFRKNGAIFSGGGWTTGTGIVYTTNLTDKVGIGTTNPLHRLVVSEGDTVSQSVGVPTCIPLRI
jgi:hypothetical protein